MENAVNAAQIYHRTGKWNFEERQFTGDMLRILNLVNGRMTLFEIGEKLELGNEMVTMEIHRLLEYDLIEADVAEDFRSEAGGRLSEQVYHHEKSAMAARQTW